MHREQIDREGARRASTARTLAASMMVIGLAGLIWLHTEHAGDSQTPAATSDAVAPCLDAACLHALAGDPSVPTADRVFARGTAYDALPPIPTF